MKKILLLCLLILFLVPIAYAKQGHMKLLAVTETLDGSNGSVADLTLEIRPGNGKVFVDTFPLTKFDTQISMRFAKQIACNFLDVDCSGYDFSYTIKAESGIIGGPSAGAAASTLTALMLKNIEFDERVAVTGTINSGGVIGPVGGLKEKISAAARDNITTVLISTGQMFATEDGEDNITTDLIAFGKEINITVIEVASLDEAAYHFSGKEIAPAEEDLAVTESYKEVMRSLAENLCNRSMKLRAFFNKDVAGKISDSTVLTHAENAMNLTKMGEDAYSEERYYSSASYCFRANVDFSYLVFYSQYPSAKDISEKTAELNKRITDFEEKVEKKELKTITDLQAYMIVKERILESKDYMNSTLESTNDTQDTLFLLAFAFERLNSAESWSSFFGTGGKEFALEPERIKESCQSKIAEAEERYQYVKMYILQPIETVDIELKRAYEDLEKGDYELCLYKASKAKAEADSIVSVFGVETKNLDKLFEQKVSVTEKTLARSQQKGIFPIIGYSYYEYAQSIKDADINAALLFLEYSLEVGNLDVYFEPKKPVHIEIDFRWIGFILIGVAIGIIIMIPIKLRKQKKKSKAVKTSPKKIKGILRHKLAKRRR
jgi:uncharacterized protein